MGLAGADKRRQLHRGPISGPRISRAFGLRRSACLRSCWSACALRELRVALQIDHDTDGGVAAQTAAASTAPPADDSAFGHLAERREHGERRFLEGRSGYGGADDPHRLLAQTGTNGDLGVARADGTL
jgi:hypothetical protein